MIDYERIGETCKTKFLGVLIDNKLTWKDHINYISGKSARGNRVIIKAREYLNKYTLLSLYYSFVYPYLTYCNQVWLNTNKSYLEKIIVQQKRGNQNNCWSASLPPDRSTFLRNETAEVHVYQ